MELKNLAVVTLVVALFVSGFIYMLAGFNGNYDQNINTTQLESLNRLSEFQNASIIENAERSLSTNSTSQLDEQYDFTVSRSLWNGVKNLKQIPGILIGLTSNAISLSGLDVNWALIIVITIISVVVIFALITWWWRYTDK